MVSFEPITVTLITVPGLFPIAEYKQIDNSQSHDVQILSEPFKGVTFDGSEEVLDENPEVDINRDSSVVSTLLAIPEDGSEQFWVHCSITPPLPIKALYFFKMFIDGKDVVSWGVSSKNSSRTSVRFTLDKMEDTQLFNFSQPVNEIIAGYGEDVTTPQSDLPSDTRNHLRSQPALIIKVYRAKGRKAVSAREAGYFPSLTPGSGSSIK